MQVNLTKLRHEVTGLDSAIDIMRVEIGEIDIAQATQDYQM